MRSKCASSTYIEVVVRIDTRFFSSIKMRFSTTHFWCGSVLCGSFVLMLTFFCRYYLYVRSSKNSAFVIQMNIYRIELKKKYFESKQNVIIASFQKTTLWKRKNESRQSVEFHILYLIEASVLNKKKKCLTFVCEK